MLSERHFSLPALGKPSGSAPRNSHRRIRAEYVLRTNGRRVRRLPKLDGDRLQLVAVPLRVNHHSVTNLQVLQRRVRAALQELG